MTTGHLVGRYQTFIAGIDIDRITPAQSSRDKIHQLYHPIPASGKAVCQFTRHGQGMDTVTRRQRINCLGDWIRQCIDTLP